MRKPTPRSHRARAGGARPVSGGRRRDVRLPSGPACATARPGRHRRRRRRRRLLISAPTSPRIATGSRTGTAAPKRAAAASPGTSPAPTRAQPEPDGASQADTDGDGIADLNDACPKSRRIRDGFEDADGCPDPDNDHDRILDENDKCPNEPETYNGLNDDDGCPDEGIAHWTPKVTTDPIDFDEGSSAIRPDAATFLDALAAAIIVNPLRRHGHRRGPCGSPRTAREQARGETGRGGARRPRSEGRVEERLRTQAAVRDVIACARGVDCARIRRRRRIPVRRLTNRPDARADYCVTSSRTESCAGTLTS